MENLHAFFYKGRGKSKIKNVALRIKRTLPLVTYRAWEKFTIKRQCVVCCKHAQQVSCNTIKHQFANAKFIQCVYQVVRQSGKTFRIKLFHLLKPHGIPPKTLFLSHPPNQTTILYIHLPSIFLRGLSSLARFGRIFPKLNSSLPTHCSSLGPALALGVYGSLNFGTTIYPHQKVIHFQDAGQPRMLLLPSRNDCCPTYAALSLYGMLIKSPLASKQDTWLRALIGFTFHWVELARNLMTFAKEKCELFMIYLDNGKLNQHCWFIFQLLIYIWID